MNSSNPVERLAAALLISGVLAEHLNRLSDPPVGQLLLDEVWSRLSLLSPETAICSQPVDRLRRSANGELKNQDRRRARAPTRLPEVREQDAPAFRNR
jgi:hypothetical protein